MTMSLSFPDDSTWNRLLVAIYLRADDDGLVCRTNLADLSDALGRDRPDIAADLAELIRLGHLAELEAESAASGDLTLVLMDHEAAHWYLSETRIARTLRRFLDPTQAPGATDAASIN